MQGPWSVVADLAGNVFVSDSNKIRRIDAITKNIYTVVGSGYPVISGFTGEGGPALGEEFSSPGGLAVDGSGNLYFSDFTNNRVRFVNFTAPPATAANYWGTTSSQINLVAGNGANSYTATGPSCAGITDFRFVSCLNATPAWGTGVGAYIYGVASDKTGNIYFAESDNHIVRKVFAGPQTILVNSVATTIPAGTITTVLGTGTSGPPVSGGLATSTSLQAPHGVAVDGSGNVYVSDWLTNVVWRVDSATNIATIVAGVPNSLSLAYNGDGIEATAAQLNNPSGLALDSLGNLFIADLNSRIRRVDAATQHAV